MRTCSSCEDLPVYQCIRSATGMQQNSWKEQRSRATTASHSMSSGARCKASRQAMRAVRARRAKVEQNVCQRKERKWCAIVAVVRNSFCVLNATGTDHKTSWYKACVEHARGFAVVKRSSAARGARQANSSTRSGTNADARRAKPNCRPGARPKWRAWQASKQSASECTLSAQTAG